MLQLSNNVKTLFQLSLIMKYDKNAFIRGGY